MNDVKINVRGKEMLLSTRAEQYSTNLLGLYHTSKSMEHVEMMLENFKDYDVDSNEKDLKIQIENIFAMPYGDSGIIYKLIYKQVEDFLIKAYKI
jgi:hypothetical protein